jgi:hypothetical protein
MAAKHRPPSRVKYDAAHPSVGVHTDRATYDRLLALRQRTGLPFSQLILRTLGEVELQVDAAFEAGRRSGRRDGKAVGHAKGREEGYAKAVSEFQIPLSCPVCDDDMPLRAGTPMADAAVAWLKERGWRHTTCWPAT